MCAIYSDYSICFYHFLFGCDVFFPVPMAWDVGPVATEALRQSLSTSVIFINPKFFWLIKSSLKLICVCVAPEASEDTGSRSSSQNPFRIPLHLTLIKYRLLLWQLAQLPAAILSLLLFFSLKVFCSDTAWVYRCHFLCVFRCLCCSCHPICHSWLCRFILVSFPGEEKQHFPWILCWAPATLQSNKVVPCCRVHVSSGSTKWYWHQVCLFVCLQQKQIEIFFF